MSNNEQARQAHEQARQALELAFESAAVALRAIRALIESEDRVSRLQATIDQTRAMVTGLSPLINQIASEHSAAVEETRQLRASGKALFEALHGASSDGEESGSRETSSGCSSPSSSGTWGGSPSLDLETNDM